MTRVADLAALDMPYNRSHRAHGRLEPETAAAPFARAETQHHDGRLFSAAPVLPREGAS
ncbi:hypothetical protein [Lentzea kentuckyensis]|uniref:hypothetical protein n=1 Tax=Lentzea kentuckyensis TaxID=360086 RepID=UPI00130260D4|nr:hypothetical protein [Lentzea kentuckyensis]